jgi:hypothetical protein
MIPRVLTELVNRKPEGSRVLRHRNKKTARRRSLYSCVTSPDLSRSIDRQAKHSDCAAYGQGQARMSRPTVDAGADDFHRLGCDTVASAIANESEAGKAQDQHCPCRGLGDCCKQEAPDLATRKFRGMNVEVGVTSN